ncbi:MAG: aldehyde dehydrogenase family protein, partial [Ignavibacteriae bacterium]
MSRPIRLSPMPVPSAASASRWPWPNRDVRRSRPPRSRSTSILWVPSCFSVTPTASCVRRRSPLPAIGSNESVISWLTLNPEPRMSSITELVQRHATTLADAVKANAERTFHAHWPEPPSGKIYGETANDDGLKAFQAQLGKAFGEPLGEPSGEPSGDEVSPYGFALGIKYPAYSVDTLVKRATDAQMAWQSLTPEQRASVLIEALERASKRFFEIGYATMHTTGQGFVMAFQSSGPHGFDRALEALALGYAAQTQFAPNVSWTKPMGKISVTIEKTYRLVPKGINVVIGCSTFPVWNTTPGMFAGLVTGNSVIIKPHPGAVYPIAIIVAELRKALADAGLDPNICQL